MKCGVGWVERILEEIRERKRWSEYIVWKSYFQLKKKREVSWGCLMDWWWDRAAKATRDSRTDWHTGETSKVLRHSKVTSTSFYQRAIREDCGCSPYKEMIKISWVCPLPELVITHYLHVSKCLSHLHKYVWLLCQLIIKKSKIILIIKPSQFWGAHDPSKRFSHFYYF